MNTSEEPLLLTPSQAAELAQVGRPKLDEWTHRSGFPVIRENALVRIPLGLFRRWLEAEAMATNAPAVPSDLGSLPIMRRRA